MGAAFGLAITTIVSNRATTRHASQIGASFDPKVPDSAPPSALLYGYRAAQWTTFSFAMFSLILVIVFLRNIGRVGRKDDTPSTIERDEQNERRHEGTDDVKPPSMLDGSEKGVSPV